MKLKEVKPGMAIHCTSEEQVNYLEEHGYIKRSISIRQIKLPVWFAFYKGAGLPSREWMPEYDGHVEGKTYYAGKGLTCIEFTDLILPEPELTAEEVLQICAEICYSSRCDECPMKGMNCYKSPDSDKEEIVEICQQWKFDHAKKEPEVEWVWETYIFGSCDHNVVSSEEEAIAWCERYVRAHPEERCFYRHVCKAKKK